MQEGHAIRAPGRYSWWLKRRLCLLESRECAVEASIAAPVVADQDNWVDWVEGQLVELGLVAQLRGRRVACSRPARAWHVDLPTPTWHSRRVDGARSALGRPHSTPSTARLYVTAVGTDGP